MQQTEVNPANWRELKIDGFMTLVGPLLRSTNPEGPRLYAPQTGDAHKNLIGLVHGGVLTSLLDQVIAMTAWQAADRRPTVTIQMDTRFLGPARAGDFLMAGARVRQATRSLLFVDAEITCADRLIASATAIMKISKPTGTPND